MGKPLRDGVRALPKQKVVSRAITGTVAVALLLAATRWGSYAGVSPLFLTDVLLVLAVVGLVIYQAHVRPVAPATTDRANAGALLGVFLLYVFFRGLFSMEYVFTLLWVRDITPYLYGIVAFFSAAAFARSSKADREKTMRILWWALIIHLAWVSAVLFAEIPTERLPSFPRSDVPILTIRGDVDTAVLGVTAGLFLRRVMLGVKPKRAFLGLALCVAAATQLGTRAGLISLAACLLLAFVATYASFPARASSRTIAVLLAPIAFTVGLAGLANTQAGGRLLASVFGFNPSNATERGAIGTQRARELTWDGVADWTFESDLRGVFGSGFGNDFMTQSGVLMWVQGTDYEGVRSPHNWLVGVLARLGVIGLVMAVGIIVKLLLRTLRLRARIGGDEVLMLSALIIAGFLPVALLGVVLESPFGAVPFWWAAGIILSLSRVVEKRPNPRDGARLNGPHRGRGPKGASPLRRQTSTRTT